MFRKITSIIGLLIPIIFVLNFALLFIFHPVSPKFLFELSFFGFNIEGVSHQAWFKYTNYLLIGLLIVIYSLGLIILNRSSLTNNLGAIFILVSGFLWSSLSLFPLYPDLKNYMNRVIIIMYLILFLCFFGLLLISNDIYKVIRSKSIKFFLICTSIFILLECIACIFIPNFPYLTPNLSILVYVFSFAVVGFNLSKNTSH